MSKHIRQTKEKWANTNKTVGIYIFLENLYYFFFTGKGFEQSSVRRNFNVLKAVAIYTKQSAVMQTQGYSGGGSAEQMSWCSNRRRGVMEMTGTLLQTRRALSHFQTPSIHSNRQFKRSVDTHWTVGGKRLSLRYKRWNPLPQQHLYSQRFQEFPTVLRHRGGSPLTRPVQRSLGAKIWRPHNEDVRRKSSRRRRRRRCNDGNRKWTYCQPSSTCTPIDWNLASGGVSSRWTSWIQSTWRFTKVRNS